MSATGDPHRVDSVERLLEVYPNPPAPLSLRKEVDHLTPAYADLVTGSPFVVVATHGPEGIDQSPRGDAPGFVHVRDDRTLAIPDRRGNNRLDTLRNLLHDPRIGLLFLVPRLGEELRVRGTAIVSTDPGELSRHAVRGNLPASVIVVTVERAFFQCARAIRRSNLWTAETRVEPGTLPSAGRMSLEAGGLTTEAEVTAYDNALGARQDATLY